MKTFSKEEVKEHSTADDCWVIRRNRVYDVTRFVNNHPGGAKTILDFAGEDVTLLMNTMDTHIHSKNAYGTLADMQIGILEGHENDPNIDRDEVEPVDWSKPMDDQVGSLGTDYKRWVHVPIDRWVRLFHSNILEFFTSTTWYVIPMFWIPVMCFLLKRGYDQLSNDPVVTFPGFEIDLGTWALPMLFVLGLFLWPFIEYTMHRFVFHREPESNPYLIRFHFMIHGQHHKAPFDPYHLVFPPFAAAMLAVPIYYSYSMLMPYNCVDCCFAGSILGYIFYDLTHYYIHHGHPDPNSYFGRTKKWHIRHHYIDPDNGFGVSSNILDFPFGTDFPNFKLKK